MRRAGVVASSRRRSSGGAAGPVLLRGSAVAGSRNTAGTISLAKPTGLALNDLLVGIHIIDNDGSLAAMTEPFTEHSAVAGASGGAQYTKISKRLATSGDVSSPTFDFDCSADNIHSSAIVFACQAGTFDPATPLTNVTYGTGTGSAQSAPSVTGIVNGLLCCMFACDSGGTSGSYSTPSGMTERADTSQSEGGYTTLALDTLDLASTAATGAKTSTGPNRPWRAGSFIVRPAA